MLRNTAFSDFQAVCVGGFTDLFGYGTLMTNDVSIEMILLLTGEVSIDIGT